MSENDLNCHQIWLRQLNAVYDVSRTQCIKEHATVDMNIGYGFQRYAKALLLYVYTENGLVKEAEGLLKATKHLDDIPLSSGNNGYCYLIAALRVFLLSKEGQTRQANELLQNVLAMNLSDEDEAFLFGAKGYALSRLDQGRFCSTVTESCRKATELDPENYHYLLSYAVVLGRQRRLLYTLRFREIRDRIEKEKELLKKCLKDKTPLRNVVSCFLIFIEQECTISMIKDRQLRIRAPDGFWDSINSRNKSVYIQLDELYKCFKRGELRYDPLTVLKRMAMVYSRFSDIKRYPNKRTCIYRADELFTSVLGIADQIESRDGFQQISIEYGRFCEIHKKYEQALVLYENAWKKTNFCGALLRYVYCKKRCSRGSYDPLFDIAEGIHRGTQDGGNWTVTLLCLRGDYFKTCKGDIENAISSWMEALGKDPWGKYMRCVSGRLSRWKPHSGNVDFVNELFELLQSKQRESKNTGNIDMQIFTFKNLARYYVLMKDDNKAKRYFEGALELAKESERTVEEDEIQRELENLTTSNVNGDPYESDFYQRFTQIEPLGKGGFGKVFKATHCIDGKQYAVKVVRYKSKTATEEISALSDLDHPHVVRYYSSWVEYPPANWAKHKIFDGKLPLTSTSTTGYDTLSESMHSLTLESEGGHVSIGTQPVLYIQMELCQTNLRKWVNDCVKPMNKKVLHKIFEQCLNAINYIHQKKYIHKDLKPTNIFVSEGDKGEIMVKIGDFGLAQYVKEEECLQWSHGGCSTYIAPELTVQTERYGCKVDIYSLGLIFFELLECTLDNKNNLFDKLREGEFPAGFKERHEWEHSILLKMLEINPEKRASALDLQLKWNDLKRGGEGQ